MIKTALFAVIVSSFLLACAAPPAVVAKTSAPITIKSDASESLQSGEEFTTTLTLTAQTNLKKLELSLAPYKNIELVSKNSKADFFDINTNDTRTVEVTLRLLAPVGYLSVFATTTDALGNNRTEAKALKFGTHPKTPSRSLNQQTPSITINGEKLILMPSETRP